MKKQQVHRRFIDVFELLDGTKVRFPLVTIHGSKRGPSVVVNAGSHGEEYVGCAVAHRLAEEVRLACGTMYLIPAANVQGVSQGFRFVPLGETTEWGNLNREFPGASDGKPTERIAHAIWRKIDSIRPRPSVVIDLHADAPQSYPYVLLDRFVRNPNKVLATRTRELAEIFGVTVCNDDNPEEYIADDGDRTLTGAAYNRLRIPAFVAELGGPTIVREEFVEIGVRGVKNVLAKLGMLQGGWATVIEPSTIGAPYPLRTCAVVAGDRSGLAQYVVKLGQKVRRGECLAVIKDVFGRPKGEIRAPMNGFVLSLGYSAVPQPGAIIALLAVRDRDP